MDKEILNELFATNGIDKLSLLRNLKSQVLVDGKKAPLKTLTLMESIILHMDTCMEPNDELTDLLTGIVADMCLPLLQTIHPSYDSSKELHLFLSKIANIIKLCYHFIKSEPKYEIWKQILHSLNNYDKIRSLNCSETDGIENCLDFFCCLEMLYGLAGLKEESKEKTEIKSSIFYYLLDMLIHIDEKSTCCKIIKCIVLFLSNDSLPCDDFTNRCWKTICCIHSLDKPSVVPCMVICSAANIFLPINKQMFNINIRGFAEYWHIIQEGLTSHDTLVRKQSMYLLKRTIDISMKQQEEIYAGETTGGFPIFKWDSTKCQLQEQIWDTFIMICEILEEKQVHVVKPILPRFQTLVLATEEGDGQFMHTSWLCVIIKRGLEHESLQVNRWAAMAVLESDFFKCPFLKQGQENYIVDEFLTRIQDQKMFMRPQDSPSGTIPSIGQGIIDFLTNCWSALSSSLKKSVFVRKVVDMLSKNRWVPAPLLFIFKGLAGLPGHPSLIQEDLLKLRTVLISNLLTVTNTMKGAIQSYATEFVLCAMDLDAVGPSDLASFLIILTSEGLSRGASLWNSIVFWLKKASENEKNVLWQQEEFLKLIAKMWKSNLQVHINEGSFSPCDESITQVARFVLLASDAEILPVVSNNEQDQCCLSTLLSDITDVINIICKRPYMPVVKAEKSVHLLCSLVKELGSKGTSAVTNCVWSAVDCCLEELAMFYQQRIQSGWTQMSDLPAIELARDAVGLIMERLQAVPGAIKDLSALLQCCVFTLKTNEQSEDSLDKQIQNVAAMATLSSVSGAITASIEKEGICTVPDSYVPENYQTLVKPVIDYIEKREVKTFSSAYKPASMSSQKEWGRLTSQFLSDQWSLVTLQVCGGHKLLLGAKVCLEACMESLPVVAGTSVLSLFRCMKYLLPQVSQVEEGEKTIVDCIQNCWSRVKETSAGSWFMRVFHSYLSMVIQPAILVLSPDSPVTCCVKQKVYEVLEWNDKQLMATALIRALCEVWATPEFTHCMNTYADVIAAACIFGQIYKKQDKYQTDMDAYLESLGDQCPSNELVLTHPPDNVAVRASVISLLCDSKCMSKNSGPLVENIILHLMEKYWEVYDFNSGVAFPNSLSHRQRNRIWQTILILLPCIDDTNINMLWGHCVNVLNKEKQISVRNSVEWVLLIILCKYSHLEVEFWKEVNEMKNKTSSMICSCLYILAMLGPHLPVERQQAFFSQSLLHIIPWCTAHHFNTRVHAHVCLRKLWDQCSTMDFPFISENCSIIESITEFRDESNNSAKTIDRLLDHYSMKVFNFERDISIETIFLTLPKLTCMIDDEWIRPTVFSKMNMRWMSDPEAFLLPLLNVNQDLSNMPPGTWKFKGQYPNHDVNDEVITEGNIQKKIMPWRMMMMDEESQEELEYCKKRRQQGGLILVTSLIDKPPNLGGLCRTSEIFGVSEFVIGKLRTIEDKTFQSLSVTAHKWLPITEVYETRLKEFLMEKKHEGYTLVGVEQTANSVCLTEYQFPFKTLLVLGNEKEGIPVEIINMLDVCVEIPQQGIIRSLNVHVSGALLVWEYRRQQLVQTKVNCSEV